MYSVGNALKYRINLKEERKMKKISKKITAVLLSVLLLFSVFPITAIAAETDVVSEAKADKSSVTVYLTISQNGWFLNGEGDNNDVLARLPVTVEYFDLADYGLEQFYRYESAPFDQGGQYISDTVVEQPTLLHLIIKATEMFKLNGRKYDPNTDTDVLDISGFATSMFMMNFWGYGYNLSYYVDDKYPLMAKGLGATADYILLEDGMDIDIACFDNMDFYFEGGFAALTPENAEINTGDTVDFQTYLSCDDRVTWSGETVKSECEYLTTLVYDENWNLVDKIFDNYDNNGAFSYKFDDAGTYYVVAVDPNLDPDNASAGSSDASISPAVSQITVNKKTYLYGDVDLDNNVDIDDATFAQKACIHLVSIDDFQEKLADVNNDGELDIVDVTYIQKYLCGFKMADNILVGKSY